MAEEEKSGYGKRPIWQWILIYLVIGAVVYGLIYYFVFAKNGKSYNYGSGASNNSSGTQQNSNTNGSSGSSTYGY